jgi:hypothetical protein
MLLIESAVCIQELPLVQILKRLRATCFLVESHALSFMAALGIFANGMLRSFRSLKTSGGGSVAYTAILVYASDAIVSKFCEASCSRRVENVCWPRRLVG